MREVVWTLQLLRQSYQTCLWTSVCGLFSSTCTFGTCSLQKTRRVVDVQGSHMGMCKDYRGFGDAWHDCGRCLDRSAVFICCWYSELLLEMEKLQLKKLTNNIHLPNNDPAQPRKQRTHHGVDASPSQDRHLSNNTQRGMLETPGCVVGLWEDAHATWREHEDSHRPGTPTYDMKKMKEWNMASLEACGVPALPTQWEWCSPIYFF